ncbi:uncharacterized protein LOC107477782 [Arachis duranensis]|uniref:Uncharacterized protein LOC107477782 n=1 Tax=Arachis duranensis TaxID=130453 RepID=A0A6P4CL37_ARADU|nr:uncharacterized protein LOC107477782 [Arachis duranensis]
MEAYENARIYKEKTKAFPDHHVRKKDFQEGDEVLPYKSRLRFMPGKLRSMWDGPFKVKEVKPYRVVELFHPQSGATFKVNSHRVKSIMFISHQRNWKYIFLRMHPGEKSLELMTVQLKDVKEKC